MKALAQNEIIALIADLNAFADSAESLIDTTQTNYDKDKKLLQNRHSNRSEERRVGKECL